MTAMDDGGWRMEESSESSLFFYSVFRLGPRAEGVPRLGSSSRVQPSAE